MLKKIVQHCLQILCVAALFVLSSCSCPPNAELPSSTQLNEVIKKNLILLSDGDFEYLPSDLKENEIIFLGEIHKVKPLADAASKLSVYLASHRPVVYALETCYGVHPLLEAVSFGSKKPINPMIYPETIRAFNSNRTEDKKILLTAIDIEHSIYNNKKETKLFLQELANRSISDAASQAINEEVARLTDQNTFDKVNRYLKKIKKVFLQHFDTFSPEDRDEILFSMKLLTASNRYHQYMDAGRITKALMRPWDIRYKYFIKTIERAYRKAKKRNAILLCQVGAWHASLNNKSEARYFAKIYSPTKGKVTSINMVPMYYDTRETNDTVTEEHNNIDSIVKTLMKDCKYSYLSLSELKKHTNNSFVWSKYYNSSGPNYDGLLFVRIEKNSN